MRIIYTPGLISLPLSEIYVTHCVPGVDDIIKYYCLPCSSIIVSK